MEAGWLGGGEQGGGETSSHWDQISWDIVGPYEDLGVYAERTGEPLEGFE